MKPPATPRSAHAVSLAQAAEDSPTLARLAQLARESGERLKAVESSIPATLRAAVRPGPIDGDAWCLLVDNNAAAAKLRQLLPQLIRQLQDRGYPIGSIRLKVLAAAK